MPKIFLTYKQQIDKLKNEKLLTISDETYAKESLSKISYYSLVGGYGFYKLCQSCRYLYKKNVYFAYRCVFTQKAHKNQWCY